MPCVEEPLEQHKDDQLEPVPVEQDTHPPWEPHRQEPVALELRRVEPLECLTPLLRGLPRPAVAQGLLELDRVGHRPRVRVLVVRLHRQMLRCEEVTVLGVAGPSDRLVGLLPAPHVRLVQHR